MQLQVQMELQGKSNSDFESKTAAYLHLRLPEPSESLIRYETTIQRQLAFALSQLERLQRSRKGEQVAAPVSVQISADQ
jgi:hypothetical protein